MVLVAADAVGLPLKAGMLAQAGGRANVSSGGTAAADACTAIVFDEAVQCVGKIVSVKEDEDRITLTIRLRSCNNQPVSYSEDVLAYIYGDYSWSGSSADTEAESASASGLQGADFVRQTISFKSVLSNAAEAGNPHCFNYRKYLKSKKIGKTTTIKSYTFIDEPESLRDKYEKAIYSARKSFLDNVSDNAKGMISGVLFGDTSYIEDEVYEEFRHNGTAHILAVSGLHVSILYGMYKRFVGRRRNAIALILLLAMLFLYGSLAMWSTSACRAIIMIIISVTGRYMDRRYDMLTALSIAAFILICYNPYVIFGAGFQMSFLAITSIAFLQPIVPERIPEWLTTALAVNIGLLAYQWYNFNYVSLVSLIANIPIIYMTGYFVPAALLGFCVFNIGIGWEVMRPVVEGFALMLQKTNHWLTFGGHSGTDAVSLPTFVVIATAAGIFFLASESFFIMRTRKQYKKIIVVFTIIFICSLVGETFTYSPITHDDVIFVDVGQGDCIHIKADGRNVLIDGGGDADYNVGKNKLKPYLLKNGVAEVDAALATHKHTDHYKGLTELSAEMDNFSIYTGMTAGKRVRISESDSVYIEALWPLTLAEGQEQEENKDCSVFMVHYGSYKVLVTGDLDSEGEAELIKYYGSGETLRADVLKVGHHGSKTSTSAELLAVVRPKIAVIQVGKNNYGHPTSETLDRLENAGCMIFRNDQDGAVGIKFSKSGMKVHRNLS